MKNIYPQWLHSLAFLSLSLTLCGCNFEDDAVMNPSSWAGLLIVAAVIVFFYYIFKMIRRR
ncbi:hypothetical protein ACFS7Z_27090 [Pontibacter toksunensis]|uniref:Phosphatidate cytidylyltransferase n=1 Tax=Pontibacter toksunensis TaxID=1332631 RepID=A0ABW6C4R2_9BACT